MPRLYVESVSGGRRIEHREKCLCHNCQRDAGSINSKEVRVNKGDSPRISKEIHIDRKQPLGVSLKGSSVEVGSDLRLG